MSGHMLYIVQWIYYFKSQSSDFLDTERILIQIVERQPICCWQLPWLVLAFQLWESSLELKLSKERTAPFFYLDQSWISSNFAHCLHLIDQRRYSYWMCHLEVPMVGKCPWWEMNTPVVVAVVIWKFGYLFFQNLLLSRWKSNYTGRNPVLDHLMSGFVVNLVWFKG